MSAFFPWLDPNNWPSIAPANLNQPILPGWSFFTVNESNSSAPDTERRIVSQDSYGRQIGRLMDVVDVLVKEAEKVNPTLKDDTRVKALEELKGRIDLAKQAAQAARQDRLIEDLLALKDKDKDRFAAVMAAVRP
ncbi:hypothetical protein MMA231_03345 [Asticcacaulis sp. MM231]|uniref:hypothetical protein n=1 Tax=Asticcacaulis sp. MM231 TaxID=3157666 RepID=UPI0032D56765